MIPIAESPADGSKNDNSMNEFLEGALSGRLLPFPALSALNFPVDM
jgi:hypothetical protein